MVVAIATALLASPAVQARQLRNPNNRGTSVNVPTRNPTSNTGGVVGGATGAATAGVGGLGSGFKGFLNGLGKVAGIVAAVGGILAMGKILVDAFKKLWNGDGWGALQSLFGFGGFGYGGLGGFGGFGGWGGGGRSGSGLAGTNPGGAGNATPRGGLDGPLTVPVGSNVPMSAHTTPHAADSDEAIDAARRNGVGRNGVSR